jgi:hypothetical protein
VFGVGAHGDLQSAIDLARRVSQIDWSTVAGADAAALLTSGAKLARIANAVCTHAGRRVEETAAYSSAGERDARSFVARTCGVDPTTAAAQLTVGRQLAELDVADAAFRNGELSIQQASHVARGGSADPARQAELVDLARRESAKALAARARQIAASASAAREARLRQAQHDARFCSLTTKEDGMVQLLARLAPEEGAAIRTVLDCHREAVFAEARRTGRRDTSSHYAADALVSVFEHAAGGSVALAFGPAANGADESAIEARPARRADKRHVAGTPAGGGRQQDLFESLAAGALAPLSDPRSGPGRPLRIPRVRTEVSVVIDHSALVRGFRESGERCEIPGVGSVSVDYVRDVLGDSLLRFFIAEGKDIKTVTSATRYVPASLRAALDIRDGTCQVPGCVTGLKLERDHAEAFALSKRTSLENLQHLCAWHHSLKTTKGYKLLGPPGRRRWVEPDEQDEADEQDTG